MIYLGLRIPVLNLFTKPNKKAMWVFGMQKTGTTAIASLLATRSGKSCTLDTKYLWGDYYKDIINKKLCFNNHINKFSYPFSKDIIKEPSASLMINQIEKVFKLKKYIFITRHPLDTIRSILNRLNIPGNKKSINIESIHPDWQIHFSSGESYVRDLAILYVKVYSQENYIFSDNCVLVKYEDFVEDKLTFIDGLLDEFDFEKKNDITNILDKNFQPKGQVVKDYVSYFGEENYNEIKAITEQVAQKFNYNFI
ncbi:Sulfotransferase family protein [Mesonia phycicola]|uniref:Sulfotransferase family protein n=1 Tax=Mesonia phycicola TaxID=579105 RepID=A0A1M6H2D0_9FLAO|nr:sulfotransferase [Mesonia phycicola]SHJ16358.1 Sulfotransferase family protein [Mesonia phycicola]